jgi:hypothetical protein
MDREPGERLLHFRGSSPTRASPARASSTYGWSSGRGHPRFVPYPIAELGLEPAAVDSDWLLTVLVARCGGLANRQRVRDSCETLREAM